MHANIHAAGIRAYIRILEACCGVKAGEGEEKERLGGRRMKRRRGEEERSRVERINATTTERAVLRILRCNGTVRTQHVGSGLSRLASRLFDN